MTNKKLPISAIVVGLNEGHLLENCLKSIQFCDEIIYFDLGSIDKSLEISSLLCTEVVKHKLVPGCEWIHSEYLHKVKYDWVLIIDPDEIVKAELQSEIVKMFTNVELIPSNIGAIKVPEFYFFGKYKLNGTPWGGNKPRVFIVNRSGFDFLPVVHLGRQIKKDFEYIEIKFEQNNSIDHYWMQSYRQLIEKHRRYLINEGIARFQRGDRVKPIQILIAPFKQFIVSYFIMNGYRDNFTGIFLSIFWSWYQTSALVKLYLEQCKNE
ncbi:MAG: hypothetical protein RLY43_1068 [Bacteroidota bacterium]